MARKNNRKSRRRVRSKPTERISWSNTERLQLLAYLDWCVQSCVKFEATAPVRREGTSQKSASEASYTWNGKLMENAKSSMIYLSKEQPV
ncbi:hypothetical protein LB505_013760 [Fusarium chuoi]|nr:hypothetical protein LB505_013760 [Fusarium chuoi]